MSLAANEPSRNGVWRPFSPRSFLLLFVVLAICLLGLDIALYGPLTYSAAQLLVARPAEREWGFHAELEDYGPPGDRHSLLTVVEVARGGPFDRAGIKPGFAFMPKLNGFPGPRFGGAYNVFIGAGEIVRVRMLTRPGASWEAETFDVSRR